MATKHVSKILKRIPHIKGSILSMSNESLSKEVYDQLIQCAEISIIPSCFPDLPTCSLWTVQEGCLGICGKCVSEKIVKCFHLKDVQKFHQEDIDQLKHYCYNMILALFILSDTATLWNQRKWLITVGYLSMSSEFHLTKVFLTFKARCHELLWHREWLFHYCISHSAPPALSTTPDGFGTLTEELQLLLHIASKYRCNYRLWDYRRSVIRACLKMSEEKSPERSHVQLLTEELVSVRNWQLGHVSDSSAWSYRFYLLQQLAAFMHPDELENILLETEISPIMELCRAWPYMESLWNYAKLVMRLSAKPTSMEDMPEDSECILPVTPPLTLHSPKHRSMAFLSHFKQNSK